MVEKSSTGRKLFISIDVFVISIFALLCLVPLFHILALSFSSSTAARAGEVKLLPVGFTLKAYEFAMDNQYFIHSFVVSLKRVLLGLAAELFITLITAYPLSRETRDFKQRTVYVWFLFISMIFSGGIISTYMIVKLTGIIDTIWVLIIPGVVNVFNVLLMINFFRGLPKELEEAAFIDGAGHFRVLFSILLPVSIPSVATIAVFILVKHWNSWFDGMIYMNDTANYPLQTYLQSLVINRDVSLMMTREEAELFALISERTTKSAQVFIATIPIIAVYPFLQRYFIKGMTVGSIKE